METKQRFKSGYVEIFYKFAQPANHSTVIQSIELVHNSQLYN